MKKVTFTQTALHLLFLGIAISLLLRLYVSEINFFSDYSSAIGISLTTAQLWMGRILFALAIFLTGSLLYGAWDFMKFINKLQEFNLYTNETIKKFRNTGLGFTVVGLILLLLEWPLKTIYPEVLIEHALLGFGAMGSMFLMAMGLLFMFLSSVLENGKKLKEENDLTI